MDKLLIKIINECRDYYLRKGRSLLPPFQSDLQKVGFSTSSPIEKASEEPDKLYKLIELEMRGHDPAVLKSYSYFLTTAARHLNIQVGKCWTPRKASHERLTLLRSIHVKKKYRVQYENRTYFTFAQVHRLTGSTADTFLEYIQRNLPEGVAMKVTKIGLENIPDHLNGIPVSSG